MKRLPRWNVLAPLILILVAGQPPRSAGEEPLAPSFAPLPEPVTSFGAVTSEGWLYAFGGHKGHRHDYSQEMVSGSFHRLKLSDGRAWEPLPASAPGQGLPLVAYQGFVYRIGGMAARNDDRSQPDLFSLDLFQRYDPRRGEWQDLPPLPAPRSSHDAVVAQGKIYVFGGWKLTGTGHKPVWPATGFVFDLQQPGPGWTPIPQPFQRRALALAALGTRVLCIGGMDSDNDPTLAVEIYDSAAGKWQHGPDLPPGKHKGFACSAIAQDGRIYVTTFKGDLWRLSNDARSWETVGQLDHPRMAHRLVTAGTRQLMVLGGEDGEEKCPDLELLTLKNPSGVPQSTHSY